MIQTTDNRFLGLREPKEFVEVVLAKFPDPLKNLSVETRQRAASKVGKRAERLFRRSLAQLGKLVLRCEPTRTLAHFQTYDCTFYDRAEGKEYVPIDQFGIELLQAMFLSFPAERFATGEPPPKLLLKLNKLIRQLGEYYSLRGLARERPADERLREADLLSHQVQMHTFGVRNAGFQDQVVKQLRGLFGPLDAEYQSRTGVKLSLLVTMWEQLAKLSQRRFNERFDQLHIALNGDPADEVIDLYCHSRGFDSGYRAAMMRELRRHRGNIEMARQYCIQDSDRTAFHHYLFTTGDFVAAYPEPVAADALREVMQRWAHRPGALAGSNREHFLLNNPIWDRPLIHFSPDQFYWPIIQIFHSFGLEMLERLVSEFPDLKDRYEQRIRPEYLENRAAAELRSALPTAEVLQGVKWTDTQSQRSYETDLLVLIDSVAVIAEAKAGRITQSARRGAPDRLRREIRKLIEDAAVQSARFVQVLRSATAPIKLQLRDGSTWLLDPRLLRQFVRVNITLDFFGPLACEARSMTDAGLLDPAASGASTIALVDLENMVLLLDRPAQFLHYLSRRGEIDQHMDFLADELDLLALYLGTGFVFGEFEHAPKQYFSFYGLSDQIEPFLFSKSAGISVIKPRLKLTSYWNDLLSRFEDRRFSNWTLASFALLNVGYEAQQDFEKQQAELCQRIRQTAPAEGEINTVIAINGDSQKRSAIVAVAIRKISDEDRMGTLQHAVHSAMEHGQCEEVLFLCHRVDLTDRPYYTAGLRLPKAA